ncbi:MULTISPECIES: RES family NAD+ phosphorylase [unclassified Mesorhizobium]|uniref:RES family NAD+ phosphorylase n=1 Tax=unclassified Mesorhizobium TaxID=325217 RepID=UPI00112D8D55|nr:MULTISPECIES: RES family NAD+ phosphorylase [unclassified Mesorhizobium]TPJ31495.1 RES domain-containing protein [Mesorhizobium sp. B2-7-2]TPO10485.1 RES domain-containing protein [Mesorhizobium sp. B1-1-5]
MTYSGRLYRALNPVYGREPMSGRGAEFYGGRFNPKGMPALCASTSILTALREANQVGDLQPTTLVTYRAEIEAVFDAGDATALTAMGLDAAALADPTWRDQMRDHGEAHTQRFAREMFAQGYNGLLVPSFAKGAAAIGDLNLVLWRWGDTAPSRLELIEDEQRLG